MHDLPLPQEADDVVDVRIVGKTQNVVISEAGFLFCRKVLRQISDGIAGGLDGAGGPGEAGGGGGVDPGGVVHEVGGESGIIPHVLIAEISGELVDDGRHHFHMAQLLGADIGEQPFCLGEGHGVPLGQIAHGGPQFAVGAAVLADDEGGQLGIGRGDLYRELEFFLINKHLISPRSAQNSRATGPGASGRSCRRRRWSW